MKTNYDNVVDMSVEEIVDICVAYCPPVEKLCGKNTFEDLPMCRECWLDWLKSPVGEE